MMMMMMMMMMMYVCVCVCLCRYKQMMLQQGTAAGLITAEQAPGHETQWEEEIEFFDLAGDVCVCVRVCVCVYL